MNNWELESDQFSIDASSAYSGTYSNFPVQLKVCYRNIKGPKVTSVFNAELAL